MALAVDVHIAAHIRGPHAGFLLDKWMWTQTLSSCFEVAPKHVQFCGLLYILAATDFLAEVIERDFGPGCMLERCRQRRR